MRVAGLAISPAIAVIADAIVNSVAGSSAGHTSLISRAHGAVSVRA